MNRLEVSVMRKIFMIWVVSLGALTWNVSNAFSWDFPLTLYPVAIQFNHSINSYHSIDIRVNADTNITVPEYDNSGSINQKFAYVKGFTPNVLVHFFTTTPDTPSLTIRAYGSDSWNLADHAVLFDEYGDSIKDQGNPDYYVTMGSSSSVPNSVGKHNKTWDWYVCKVGGNPIGPFWTGSSSHTYYTILNTPVSPLLEPWTDVLDSACVWANGQSTSEGAATPITNGLYSNLGYRYDQGGERHYCSGSSFDLSKFLTAGNGIYVNCLDMGAAVVSFYNSIGCNLSEKYYGSFNSGTRLNYPVNCIKPIGAPDSTNSPIGGYSIQNDCRLSDYGFEYHAYAYDSNSGKVWDATLKYDTGSDPDHVTGSNPGCGDITTPTPTWTLPTNVLESTYKSNLFDTFPKWFDNEPDSGTVSFYVF
jgi:hypothetical protein